MAYPIEFNNKLHALKGLYDAGQSLLIALELGLGVSFRCCAFTGHHYPITQAVIRRAVDFCKDYKSSLAWISTSR